MTAIGGMNLTYTVEGRERFPIRIRYMRELRDNIESLKRVLVPAPKGLHIPLGQLVKIERRPGPAKNRERKYAAFFLASFVMWMLTPLDWLTLWH